jgi:hypothetical protein
MTKRQMSNQSWYRRWIYLPDKLYDVLTAKGQALMIHDWDIPGVPYLALIPCACDRNGVHWKEYYCGR